MGVTFKILTGDHIHMFDIRITFGNDHIIIITGQVKDRKGIDA